jgi:hypothetical protein
VHRAGTRRITTGFRRLKPRSSWIFRVPLGLLLICLPTSFCTPIALAGGEAHGSVAGLTATATLSEGSLAIVSPLSSIRFPATLNRVDRTVSSTQSLNVSDATGRGTGWSLTATSTTFTSGAGHLPPSAATIPVAPLVACDRDATCNLATTSISYPYTLPAGVTAPLATRVFSAAPNTGLGAQTVDLTWHLALPANTSSGTYTSTWTMSLVSGP